MLTAFSTNVLAKSGALATKYNVPAEASSRVVQASLVWNWFSDALTNARNWSQRLTTTRRFVVEEPLPAPGTAEVWVFEVQYRYGNKPFDQISQPINLTVRG